MTFSFSTKILLIIGGIVGTATLGQLLYVHQMMKESFKSDVLWGIVVIQGVMLLCIGFALRRLYHTSCSRPLSRLRALLHSPASSSSDITSWDAEVQQFSYDLQTTLEEKTALFEHLHDLSQHILEFSHSASTASANQSELVNSQLSSSETMAATIRELVMTGQHSSDDVKSVVDVANQTLQFAEQGQQAVFNVVKSMKDIQASSQVSSDKIIDLGKQSEHVNDVVKTIDRIIEDTKLIAFNATIEAARAKDEGRGFGVVALEIKRLAEEVFESTEDIKELIHDIQEASHALVLATEEEMKTVHRGAQLAEDAGTSLRQIYQMAKLTTDSAQRIASAAEQQQGASTQALQAVEAANRSIKTFSTEMKHLTATTADIKSLADELEKSIARVIRNA